MIKDLLSYSQINQRISVNLITGIGLQSSKASV